MAACVLRIICCIYRDTRGLCVTVKPRLIDGKSISAIIRDEIKAGVDKIVKEQNIIPGLAIVLIGDDPASNIYVNNKLKAAKSVGMIAEDFRFPATISQKEILNCINRINQDNRFHGLIVQLPLPDQIDKNVITRSLDPYKDVDGLHPGNVGLLVQGRQRFVPATPAGIQQMLLRSGYDPEGMHVVICGRSEIVGKPLAVLLMQPQLGGNATVTICHTKTVDLPEITRQADIIIAAIGKPNFINADMVQEGTIVIDVGVNRITDQSQKKGYSIVGDVDFKSVSEKAEAISPVPGGVGPMTIAMLLQNTLRAATLSINS